MFNAKGAEKTSGVIATGDSVAVYDIEGTQKMKFNIVIFGDIDGDGEIGAIDALRLKKHFLEITKITGMFVFAADINRDEQITAIDSLRIKKHMLEIEMIKQ